MSKNKKNNVTTNAPEKQIAPTATNAPEIITPEKQIEKLSIHDTLSYIDDKNCYYNNDKFFTLNTDTLKINYCNFVINCDNKYYEFLSLVNPEIKKIFDSHKTTNFHEFLTSLNKLKINLKNVPLRLMNSDKNSNFKIVSYHKNNDFKNKKIFHELLTNINKINLKINLLNKKPLINSFNEKFNIVPSDQFIKLSTIAADNLNIFSEKHHDQILEFKNLSEKKPIEKKENKKPVKK